VVIKVGPSYMPHDCSQCGHRAQDSRRAGTSYVSIVALSRIYSSSSPIRSLAGIAKAFDSFGPGYRGQRSVDASLPIPKLES
jgi:hypothetical protein